MITLKTNKERFIEVYTEKLRYEFTYNQEYFYSAARTTPKDLALKMTEGLIAGTANKDGDAIKKTCKQLGIKHTYKAIKEYLNT